MKKLTLIAMISIILILSFIYTFESRDRRLTNRGNRIVDRVEEFKRNKKRLPNTLEELGITEEDELFYSKWDSSNYIIWYGTTLGESVTYYSDTKKWEEINRAFKDN